MRIGILGSGLIGGKLGTIFARMGHDVVFSYSRSRQKLKVSDLPRSLNSVRESASFGTGINPATASLRRKDKVLHFVAIIPVPVNPRFAMSIRVHNFFNPLQCGRPFYEITFRVSRFHLS